MTTNLSPENRQNPRPHRNEEPASPLIDQRTIEMYRKLSDKKNDDVVKRVLSSYLRCSHDLYTDLKQSIHDTDEKKVEMLAHTLKSSASLVGAFSLSELFKQLESSVCHHRMNEVDDSLLDDISTLYIDVRKAIEQILADRGQ